MSGSDKLILFVGGLDEKVTEQTLLSAFIPFGEVKNIEVARDHYSKESKGYAFIEMHEYEDCEHAIFNMNDSEIFGRIIRVTFAQPKKFKEGMEKPIWMEEDYYLNRPKGRSKESMFFK